MKLTKVVLLAGLAIVVSASPIARTVDEPSSVDLTEPVNATASGVDDFATESINALAPGVDGFPTEPIDATASGLDDFAAENATLVLPYGGKLVGKEHFAGPLNGDVAPPPGAVKPGPGQPECKAYVSRVWDYHHNALHRHKHAYWCENCPKNIDWWKAGDLWNKNHGAKKCVALDGEERVYHDDQWKNWVVEESELFGMDSAAACMQEHFAWKWGTYACGFGKQYVKANVGSAP